jgi:hypothetical protein
MNRVRRANDQTSYAALDSRIRLTSLPSSVTSTSASPDAVVAMRAS